MRPETIAIGATKRRLIRSLVLASALFAGAGIAHAIPSPELVVGSLSSLSQLVALASATLGGGAVLAGAQAGRSGRKGSPWLGRVAMMLGVAACASIGLNAYLIAKSWTERRERLEATLIRPTPKASGQTLDPLLKEMPYADQVRHPRGISTEDAEGLVAEIIAGRHPDWMLLDIRETAETEMGSLPTAERIRFPDLPHTPIDLKSRKALLFCHNGNRSAETCAALAEKGVDCRFIIGGLEKWLVEGRRLTGLKARTIDDLRAVPDYRNHETLLDTAEVQRMLESDSAVLVDVRYPGEFAAGHLPGAINLPIRPTPTEELKRRLAELPRRPIIVPCYDRRSCFFGEILGLEVTRIGGDFRGRYTVPWEYFVPSKRPPHVEQWLSIARVGYWEKAANGLAELLVDISRAVGLPLALLLLATVSRIAVLPFALKSERDQIVGRTIEAEVSRLKQKLAAEPRRLSRALSDLYSRHGLTPGRNVIALAFLPILALSAGAAGAAAAKAPEAFLWLDTLADRDGLLILPAMFGILIGLYVDWSLVTKRWHRLVNWLVAVPLLAIAAALLTAAADLYMIASAALLLVQRAFVTGAVARILARIGSLLGRLTSRRLPHAAIVPLSEPGRLQSAGNKALRLAQMKAAGIPVPDGLVLTAPFLAAWPSMPDRQRRRLQSALWSRLGGKPLAVRSSAEGEDGASQSFAGVFETEIDVQRERLGEAIERVAASFSAERTAAYSGPAGCANVLLQPMVDAEHAGVLFTEDPEIPGVMLVEMVEGSGEKLVSGRAAPKSYRYGRLTGLLRSSIPPPIDVSPLLALARRIEALFGRPQDIEWVFAKGRFHIVQSRDITTLGEGDAVREEWRRLVGLAAQDALEGVILAQNEMTEMLPRPTPASLSLLEALWSAGGSIDRAAEVLGIQYRVGEESPPYHVTAFGRLYVDKRQEAARAPRLGALSMRRITAHSKRIEASFRDGFLPAFMAEMRLLEATDLDRLPNAELVETLRRVVDGYINRTHVEVDVVNILARFHLDEARRALAVIGRDAAEVLSDIPTPAATAALQLAGVAPKAWRDFQLREALGHRAVLDYELSDPRFGESPEALKVAAERAVDTLWNTAVGRASASSSLDQLPVAARGVVETARRFQTLKEDAKHHMLRQVAVIRSIIRAIDRRFALNGNAFYLSIEELQCIEPRGARELARLAETRKAAAGALRGAPMLGSELTAADIETSGRAAHETGAGRAPLHGTRVAGTGSVMGRAIVVSAGDAESGEPILGFMDGDIIVAPMIHPGWLAEVVRAGGVVSAVGGWLSHMAIVAREHNVTMIVGATGLEAITTGMHITLHADGRIEPAAPAVTRRAAAE